MSYFDEAINIGEWCYRVASVFNGNTLSGKVIRYTDHLGISRDFLMTADDRIAGILFSDITATIDDWTSVISSLAGSGVNTTKKGIIQAVQSGKMSPSQLQTYVSLSDEARELYSYNSLWTY